MIKLLFLLFSTLLLIRCGSTSYFTTYADGSGDNELYINTDLKISIHQKRVSRIFPRRKPKKNDRVLNKSLKIHRLRMRSEILLYVEDLDKDIFARLVEFYPRGLSEKDLLRKLKRRKFKNISEVEGVLMYEKKLNESEYFFGERFEQLEKGTIRIVTIAKKDTNKIPSIWAGPDLVYDKRRDSMRYTDEMLVQIEKKYIKGLRESTRFIPMSYEHFDKLAEDKSVNGMETDFFQKDLYFNYSRLNSILNKALKDTIVIGEDSRFIAQTLLSYLSRNEEIYKLEANKPIDLDSLISDSEIISVDSLFAQIKEQDIRMLMINDAYYWPQCRYQASNLLEGLKGNGFNTIFLEGVSYGKVISFVEDVEKNTGVYLSNPTFGNFLKKAVTLGYTIYGYDVKSGIIQKGSKLQAENIINIINNKQLLNRDSRAIVYCGANQGKLKDDGSNPLGHQLKNKLEARILSIDQTVLIGSEEIVTQMKALAKNKAYLVKPSEQHNGGFDYYLFESNNSYFTNAPDYVYDLGAFKVDIEKYFTPEVSFISIYKSPTFGDALPVFTCSRESRKNNLKLSVGDYFVRTFDKMGAFLKGERLKVEI